MASRSWPVLIHKLKGNGYLSLRRARGQHFLQLGYWAALRAIHDLVEDASQFIICHALTDAPGLSSRQDHQLDGFGAREVSLNETDHFAVTRDFLNNYQARMQELLSGRF